VLAVERTEERGFTFFAHGGYMYTSIEYTF
jgi:hypothetical protein